MINQLITNFMFNILIIASLVTGIKFSNTHDAEIDRLLKKLNKPALKSIQSPDGDIIDCVHMKNHPIYDHPLFKNHTIQMRPSTNPEGWKNEPSDVEKKSIVTQLWTINGKCPENSIPIRRTKREDILRAKSIERYGKKDFNNIRQFNLANSTNDDDDDNREYALLEAKGTFRGARGIINLWRPLIQVPEEFSLAQMWIWAGPNDKVNTIEFGWQVYPEFHLNNTPRYFIYWTADGYKDTGCYNLDCPGFVLVSPEFALDVAIHNVSILYGQQYEIPTTIWRDPHTGNWWLKVNYHIDVGYWPSKLFNHLEYNATKIHFGGEIVNLNVGGQHTQTRMGSGQFSLQGYKKASYFRNLEIFDLDGSWKHFQIANRFVTKPTCYDLLSGHNHAWGNYFYYGGPGRSLKCL